MKSYNEKLKSKQERKGSTFIIIDQLLRAATSIGANYIEASILTLKGKR